MPHPVCQPVVEMSHVSGTSLSRPEPPWPEILAYVSAERWRAVGAFLVIFVPALIISALLPPRYQASATLAVLPAPEFTVRPDAGSKDQNNSALALDQIMKTETEILASDRLHDTSLAVLDIAKIYPDLGESSSTAWPARFAAWLLRPWFSSVGSAPEKARATALRRFADHLTIRASKDANVVVASFTHAKPEWAARALNTLLATYARLRTRLYDDPQLAAVTAQMQTAQNAAATAAARLAAFKSEHGISDFAAQRDLLLKRLSDVRQALQDALTAAAEQGVRERALATAVRTVRPIDLYREDDRDARLQTLDDGLTELRGRLAAARVHYLESSRMVADLRRQIGAREAERARRAADSSPSVQRTGRPPSLDPLLVDRARAAVDRSAAVQRARSLSQTESALTAELAALQNQEQTLDVLEREKDRRDETLRTASRVFAERRLTESEDTLRLANVRVIQPAQMPLRPTLLKPLIVLAGAVMGAFASLGMLVCGFLTRATFLTGEGLAAATDLPVLAVLPRQAVPA